MAFHKMCCYVKLYSGLLLPKAQVSHMQFFFKSHKNMTRKDILMIKLNGLLSDMNVLIGINDTWIFLFKLICCG